jgi:DNA-binding FrmR family transcriptional regulator
VGVPSLAARGGRGGMIYRPKQMLSEDEQRRLQHRLRRVVGQVEAIGRMIDEDQSYVEVVMQISAANGALAKVAQILLHHHLEGRLEQATASLGPEGQEALVGELVELFEKYAQTK